MLLATLCYVQRDGHTLMVLRNKKPDDIHAGKWNGLGGKFEPGETPEGCVVREVREESGLEIRAPQWRGWLIFPAFYGADWYVFVFSAAEFSGELSESSEGTLQWVRGSQLESLNLWESDHIFLPWIAAGKFFSAKFQYQGKTLLKHEVHFYSSE